MIKRILILTVITLILQSAAFAQSPPVFGPNQYERTTGKPNISSDTFQSCNTGAAYKLIVENGESGKNRISSASITLNDNEIIKENEFNQKIDKIEKTITLQNENTLNIKLASGPGGFIKVSVSCVANCLEVKITTPATGSAINKSKTIIKGSLYNSFGETGVTLKSSGANGEVSVLAQTQAANLAGSIPLQIGTNTITATATDACGYKATDTITINTESIEDTVRLTAAPNSGIPNPTTGTLDVNLEAEVNIENTVSKYSWDINGDGTPEQEGSDIIKVTANYQNTGLYFPSVTVTDTSGNTYTEAAIVNVLSRDKMDALLKDKWEGMKGVLGQGNVEKALRYIADQSQKMYRYNFELMSSILPTIVQDMGNITLVKIADNMAEYEMTATQDGQTLSFYVEFVKDTDGIWRIRFY